MPRGARNSHDGLGWPDRSPPAGAGGAYDEGRAVAEADHRIANQLAILAAFVRLKTLELEQKAAEPDRRDILSVLANVRAQIDAIARLHRGFALGQSGEATDLGDHLNQVCAALVATLSGSVELVQDHQADCLVRPDQILPLTQIVAEVITNAVKYAHPLGERGVILVRSRRDGEGDIVVEVVDDGPGLPADVNLVTGGGLGFRLMRALGLQLGARVSFASGAGGLRFRITLPADRIGADMTE